MHDLGWGVWIGYRMGFLGCLGCLGCFARQRPVVASVVVAPRPQGHLDLLRVGYKVDTNLWLAIFSSLIIGICILVGFRGFVVPFELHLFRDDFSLMTFLDMSGQSCLSTESVSAINQKPLDIIRDYIVLTVFHSTSGRCMVWCHCVFAGALPGSTTAIH